MARPALSAPFTALPATNLGDLQTKERLIRAAVILFQKSGYHGTGTAALLEAARAPKGSLYHHFPGGKADVAIAAIGWIETEIVAALSKTANSGKMIADLVAWMFEGTARWAERTGYEQSPLLAAITSAGAPDEVMAAAEQTYRAAEDALLPLTGGSRDLATLVIAGLDGSVVLARSRRNAEPIRATGRELGRFLLPRP
ncbi:MAG: helix-turn-helix domain-containing protein [Pseudomonadota bacterium]